MTAREAVCPVCGCFAPIAKRDTRLKSHRTRYGKCTGTGLDHADRVLAFGRLRVRVLDRLTAHGPASALTLAGDLELPVLVVERAVRLLIDSGHAERDAIAPPDGHGLLVRPTKK